MWKVHSIDTSGMNTLEVERCKKRASWGAVPKGEEEVEEVRPSVAARTPEGSAREQSIGERREDIVTVWMQG